LSHEFVDYQPQMRKATTGPLTQPVEPVLSYSLSLNETELHKQVRAERPKIEDPTREVVHRGMLWKLNFDGDVTNKTHFLQRDFWINAHGSLAYFSQKEQKMLAIISNNQMAGATITRLEDAARSPAFKVTIQPEHEDEVAGAAPIDHIFACESEEDFNVWVEMLHRARLEMMRTMCLGAEMAQDLMGFKLAVKNRRKTAGVTEDSDGYKPLFRSNLWKVITNGNRMSSCDWRERDMWLAKNGSFCYWSSRDEKELVYYTHCDLEAAIVTPIPKEESFYPWSFQVQLGEVNGLEFAPGEFAAESEEMRDRWIAEFHRFMSS